MKITATKVKNGVVISLIVAEQAGLNTLEAAYKADDDCDILVPVDRSVQIGDTYDADKSVFLRNGVRIYPDKTDSERIAELEQELNDVQLALCEIYETR